MTRAMTFCIAGTRIPVTVRDWASLDAHLRERLRRRAGFAVATINLDHLVKLRRDPAFRAAYAAHDLVTADGNPIVWLGRMAGHDLSLVPGSDAIVPICRIAAALGVKVGFVGSTEATLAAAKTYLEREVPGLSVVFTEAPPMGFDPEGPAARETLARWIFRPARLEGELDTIADGEPWVPIIAGFYSSFEQNLETADEEIEKVDIKTEPEPVGRDCPDCGSELLYRTGRYGRFIGCSNFPSCRYTEQILVKTGVTCPQCNEGDLVERRTRRGRIFYGCTNYPDCDWTSWKKPVPQACPECGGVMVMAKKDTVRCIKCKTEATLRAQEPEPA